MSGPHFRSVLPAQCVLLPTVTSCVCPLPIRSLRSLSFRVLLFRSFTVGPRWFFACCSSESLRLRLFVASAVVFLLSFGHSVPLCCSACPCRTLTVLLSLFFSDLALCSCFMRFVLLASRRPLLSVWVSWCAALALLLLELRLFVLSSPCCVLSCGFFAAFGLSPCLLRLPRFILAPTWLPRRSRLLSVLLASCRLVGPFPVCPRCCPALFLCSLLCGSSRVLLISSCSSRLLGGLRCLSSAPLARPSRLLVLFGRPFAAPTSSRTLLGFPARLFLRPVVSGLTSVPAVFSSVYHSSRLLRFRHSALLFVALAPSACVVFSARLLVLVLSPPRLSSLSSLASSGAPPALLSLGPGPTLWGAVVPSRPCVLVRRAHLLTRLVSFHALSTVSGDLFVLSHMSGSSRALLPVLELPSGSSSSRFRSIRSARFRSLAGPLRSRRRPRRPCRRVVVGLCRSVLWSVGQPVLIHVSVARLLFISVLLSDGTHNSC